MLLGNKHHQVQNAENVFQHRTISSLKVVAVEPFFFTNTFSKIHDTFLVGKSVQSQRRVCMCVSVL